MITQIGSTFFVFICLCSAIPIKTFASIEGSYSTPSDARALRQYVVGVFSGKLAFENAGDIYLAKEMDKTERADFAEYLKVVNHIATNG